MNSFLSRYVPPHVFVHWLSAVMPVAVEYFPAEHAFVHCESDTSAVPVLHLPAEHSLLQALMEAR